MPCGFSEPRPLPAQSTGELRSLHRSEFLSARASLHKIFYQQFFDLRKSEYHDCFTIIVVDWICFKEVLCGPGLIHGQWAPTARKLFWEHGDQDVQVRI